MDYFDKKKFSFQDGIYTMLDSLPTWRISRIRRKLFRSRAESQSAYIRKGEGSTALSPSGRLCNRCSSINFEKVFRATENDWRFDRDVTFFKMDLGTAEVLNASTCPLCQIFAAMVPTHLMGDKYYLQATVINSNLERSQLPSGRKGRKNPVVFYVDRERSGRAEEIGPFLRIRQHDRPPRPFDARILSRDSFDVPFVRGCLDYCKANHGRKCNVSGTQHLESLRVIDCERRTVVEAPSDCQFAALSYVWGTRQPAASLGDARYTNDERIALDDVPKTVSDSIKVTLALKLRYLWVDQYCIDQNDEADKNTQVSQMYLIYSHAFVCIIAAAGEDSNYGLPGVNGTLRAHQPLLSIGKYSLVSTLSNPASVLGSSKWATRGWTYQEGISSNCRLVFTNEQVVFECNVMHCAESWFWDLDELHTSDKTGFKSDPASRAFYVKVPGADRQDITKFITEYSQRYLSYAEDKLNAIRGILSAFEKAEFPLYHFLGVPIFTPDFAHSLDDQQPHSPVVGFLIGLTSWYLESPGKRLSQFASWSWAGWDGRVSVFVHIQHYRPKLETPEVQVEMNSNILQTYPKDFENLPPFLDSLSVLKNRAFLHIETKACMCKIMSESPPNRLGEVRLHIRQNMFLYAAFFPDGDSEFDSEREFSALLFGNSGLVIKGLPYSDYGETTINTIGIVVEEKKRGFFERIGLMTFYYPRFEPLEAVEGADLGRIFTSWYGQLPKKKFRLG